MTLGGSELVVMLVLAELLTLGGLGFVVLRLVRARRETERAATLGLGAVLLVEDGRVIDASEEAAALLAGAGRAASGAAAGGGNGEGNGEGNGDPAAALLGRPARELLEGFLDCCRETALASLARLAETGEAFELLVGDRQGRAFALCGSPRGALLRLELRDAAFLEAELVRARGEIAAREWAFRERETEAAALSSLIGAGPLVAWSRDAQGRVVWAAGRISGRQGTVCAEQVAALAAARRARAGAVGAEAGMAGLAADLDSGSPPGSSPGSTLGSSPGSPPRQAEHFRLELRPAEGDGLVALDAFEAPAADGGRHGFAVDAGSALEAERTLARFVRTMTDTFAHLNVGLAIFDRNQRLALFNPALVEMWRADPAWLARRPSLREILDRLRANRRIPEAADFHAWRARLTGLFEDTEAAQYEELWHLADGSDIRVLARPHPHGSIAFVLEDVTERLRLEQQFRHSIDLRRATLDRLEEGLAVFGPDGLLQFVNAAFHDIWGTDGESVRPMMHVRELIPLIGGLSVETGVWQRLTEFITSSDSRQPWGARLTLGTGRVLSARFAGLPDGSTMAVFGDVTDSERIASALRERNEVLEAAEEMRSAVLDRISHRLRTPLHAIFGFSQLLVDPRFGTLSEAQGGYAAQILDSARQLLGAVDDVTELAALELDPLHQEEGDLSLADTLLFTARLLEKRATEEGVALRVSVPEADLRPACEPGRLRQIVFGLATAAIGSCREGGEVELGAGPGAGAGAGAGAGDGAGDGAGGSVEVRIAVTVPERAAGAQTPVECASLPFLRRLAAQSGGEIGVRRGEAAGWLVGFCRFPVAEAPPPVAGEAGAGDAGEAARSG